MSLKSSLILSLSVLASLSLRVLASPMFMDTPTSTGGPTPTNVGNIDRPQVVYATITANAKPAVSLRQATRQDVVKRALDGPKARRATPSSIPAPDFLYTNQDAYPFAGGRRSSGTLVSPYFEPSWGFYIQKTTYPPFTPQNTVLQACADFTHTRPTSFYFNDDGYYSFEVWYDTSAEIWNCEAFFNVEWNLGSWNKTNLAADPVFGYTLYSY